MLGILYAAERENKTKKEPVPNGTGPERGAICPEALCIPARSVFGHNLLPEIDGPGEREGKSSIPWLPPDETSTRTWYHIWFTRLTSLKILSIN